MSDNKYQSSTQTLVAPPPDVVETRKMRRVLVVSYDFPPNRTSAVYRMVGLTRSLPNYGWQPTVLSIKGGDFPQEPELLHKLSPDIEIVRTRFLRIDAWENKTANAIHSVGGLQSGNGEPGKPRKSRKTDNLLRTVAGLVRSTLYFPDETAGWIPYAFAKSVELHRKQPFDVIWTTAPPRAASVVGLLLKTIVGIPLVTEFMDPWWPHPRPLRHQMDEWLQARLLRNSERVVVMLRQHAEEFMRTFGISSEKFVVVRNGFFEEDFTSIEHLKPNPLDPAYFHLSHFGTIYPRNEGKFFVALAELLKEKPELKKQIRLHLIGFPCEEVLRYAKESELKDITEVHGFLPKREDMLQMMRSSDCLVACWGREDISRLAIAGKTYDYLRAGRPIIAVTVKGGGIDELVQNAKAGWVVPPQDTEAIKQTLRQVFSDLRKKKSNGPPMPEYVAQFQWDRLAEPLARAFDEATVHVT